MARRARLSKKTTKRDAEPGSNRSSIVLCEDARVRRLGFTIVELLIVIVVIAILAAITIVAYNGITGRARTSAAASDAEQAAKKVLGLRGHQFGSVPGLARYEFALSPMLHDNQPSRALYRLLGREPQEFVQMIQALYRAEGEPKRTPSAQEQAFAHLAFNVLRDWKSVPGQREDGTIDGDALFAWVRSARPALSDSGRGSVGDEQIGEVLAASPVGTDGIWPAEEVRDVIDTLGSSRIDTGLNIGRSNHRGMTSRGAFEGGTQERALEEQYRREADAIATKWPRTARVLRSIAESYRSEARLHDLEAESWGDEG